jgi:glycosyltransferase involved in cell wall biosynthesis
MRSKPNKRPLVSVIIPCYNYGKYVVDAIESALANTYKNIEIIIVNDCSTDAYTNELLSNLVKPKTRVINHSENKGLPSTRNTGIALSSGKYIVPLDADDTIHPLFIEKTVQVLENRPRVGFVSTGIRYFGDRNFIHVPPRYNFYRLLFTNITSVTSTFRRVAWEQVGGFKDNMRDGYEDWEFWISIGEKGWLGHLIPDVLFNYRKHGHSMLTDAVKKHDELVQKIRNNHPELYKPENLNQLKGIWKGQEPNRNRFKKRKPKRDR